MDARRDLAAERRDLIPHEQSRKRDADLIRSLATARDDAVNSAARLRDEQACCIADDLAASKVHAPER